MTSTSRCVDAEGIRLPDDFAGSADVYFDDHRGWSFTLAPGADRLVRWPRKMHRFLRGTAHVRVVAGDRELLAETVTFTTDPGRVEMVDKHGLPVIVDKWGLVQRPFAGRPSSVVTTLAEEAEHIMDVVRSSCGLESWIAFGTLLGAARNGAAIGHDSDVDLCYLSTKSTPAEMTTELWSICRALRAAGMRVLVKSGSFLTVQVKTPDGAGAGIDLYTTFFLDGLFYETATVRAPLPRSALLPLGVLPFEGRMLPAPADPGRLLSISYGPDWKVPDPSFKHQPGPEIEDRFHGWFGLLWRQRRDWTALNVQQATEGGPPSDFATWVASDLAEGTRVVEIGAGAGFDAQLFAQRGFDVVALDYALPGPRRWPDDTPVRRFYLNLYDERDVLTRAALLLRHSAPQAFYVREVLETLAPDGLANFWLLLRTALRRGGSVYLEGCSWPEAAVAAQRRSGVGGRIRPMRPDDVLTTARSFGADVVRAEGIAAAADALAGPADAEPLRWRIQLRWPAPAPHHRSEGSP